MSDLIREYADYDSFARAWHAQTLGDRGVSLKEARERDLISERDTRQLWQLLGLIDEESVFVQLPAWLVEEKVSDAHESLPTTFVGRIARETDDAVLFENSSSGRRLRHIAHKIHSLEHGLENTSSGGPNEPRGSRASRF